jgi:NADH-quinone oxidoreductase subunit H
MKFGMFFVAEFLHAFTVGALTAVLFLGGWRGPWAEQVPILGVLYFMIKAMLGYFLVILLRTTLPRIRIDHMLDLNWKFLTPLALASIVFVAIADKAVEPLLRTLQPGFAPWARGGVLFLANLLLIWIAFQVLSATARRIRRAEAPPVVGPPGGAAIPAGHEAASPIAAHGEAHPSPAH